MNIAHEHHAASEPPDAISRVSPQIDSALGTANNNHGRFLDSRIISPWPIDPWTLWPRGQDLRSQAS